MGANMVRRLARDGHQCVVHDVRPEAVEAVLEADGVAGAATLVELVDRLAQPRVVWLMVPAARVDQALATLAPMLSPEDIVIDGGNSHFHDDIRRAAELRAQGIHYVDVGTSGGIAGYERGYCLMIGGETHVVEYLAPLFATLAPGADAAPLMPGRDVPGSTAAEGYLHCGPHGAGHFVKMIHNGIEYGIMGAYAEGLNILRHANIGKAGTAPDAETAPLRAPELYQYDFDLAEITELWRRGSVIGSWLLDLIAEALLEDPALEHYAGRVSDSGEGRWTVAAAIDEAVPAPILSAALFGRFSSRGNAGFADQVLSAMRHGFGGHLEKVPERAAGER
jgi:6-phosphogluconate dehydrogenase